MKRGLVLFGNAKVVKDLDSDSVKLVLVNLLDDLELDRNLFAKSVASWSTHVEISVVLSLISEDSVIFNTKRNVQEKVGHFRNVGIDWKINILQ